MTEQLFEVNLRDARTCTNSSREVKVWAEDSVKAVEKLNSVLDFHTEYRLDGVTFVKDHTGEPMRREVQSPKEGRIMSDIYAAPCTGEELVKISRKCYMKLAQDVLDSDNALEKDELVRCMANLSRAVDGLFDKE